LVGKNMANAGNYAELGQYVDPPALVDYLLCSFYSGMDDWPANNWWGGNRNSPAGPFQFFTWDEETVWGTGNGSNLTAWVHPTFRSINPISSDAPAVKIWHAARANPNFITLIGDRLQKHLSAGGALSTSEAVARWNRINTHIEDAIYGECARWGDTMQEPPVRPTVEWQNEVNRVRNIMLTGTPAGTGTTDNATLLKNAMRAQGFFPAIEAPTFSQEGGEVALGYPLEMVNPNATGLIYYTLDGTDPKQSNGGVAGSATLYTGHELGDDWTALVTASVVLGSDDEVEVLAVDIPQDESPAAFFRLSVTVGDPWSARERRSSDRQRRTTDAGPSFADASEGRVKDGFAKSQSSGYSPSSPIPIHFKRPKARRIAGVSSSASSSACSMVAELVRPRIDSMLITVREPSK
jgi:hypothetical protein